MKGKERLQLFCAIGQSRGLEVESRTGGRKRKEWGRQKRLAKGVIWIQAEQQMRDEGEEGDEFRWTVAVFF